MDLSILAVRPVRDVDWRAGQPRPSNSLSKNRPAAGQQRGVKAPPGYACSPCGTGYGPFETCRVLFLKDKIAFEGACCGCAWGGKGSRCSLRTHSLTIYVHSVADFSVGRESPLPEWIAGLLRRSQPDNPLLRKEPSDRSVSSDDILMCSFLTANCYT